MDRPLRFGIVGCGVIAATHATAINQLGNASFVACCDIIPEKAVVLAKTYNISEQHIHSTIEALLADPHVDAVSICTPSGTHAQFAIAALSAGKPVIVEKPMDISVEECTRLAAAQRESGLTVAIVSQHRFDAASLYAHDLVVSGRLGSLLFCDVQVKWFRTQEYYDGGDWRGTWELDGGGALMNQGIHSVDLMLWIMGSVKSVYAVAKTMAHARIAVEDVLCATLTFESGAIANLVASTAAYPGFPAQMSVHGTDGSVVITGDALSTVDLIDMSDQNEYLNDLLSASIAGHAVDIAQGGTRAAEQNKLSIAGVGQWGDAHRAQIAEFIICVQNGLTPISNCRTGEDAVRVVVAAYESARTGRSVDIR